MDLRHAIYTSHLALGERLCLLAYLDLGDLSLSALAVAMGCTKDTAKTHKSSVKAKGWLTEHYQPGQQSRIELHLPTLNITPPEKTPGVKNTRGKKPPPPKNTPPKFYPGLDVQCPVSVNARAHARDYKERARRGTPAFKNSLGESPSGFAEQKNQKAREKAAAAKLPTGSAKNTTQVRDQQYARGRVIDSREEGVDLREAAVVADLAKELFGFYPDPPRIATKTKGEARALTALLKTAQKGPDNPAGYFWAVWQKLSSAEVRTDLTGEDIRKAHQDQKQGRSHQRLSAHQRAYPELYDTSMYDHLKINRVGPEDYEAV